MAAAAAVLSGLNQLRSGGETFDYVDGSFTLSVSPKADADGPRRNRLLDPYTQLTRQGQLAKVVAELLQNVVDDGVIAHPLLLTEWGSEMLGGPAAYTPERGLLAALNVFQGPGRAVWIGIEHHDPTALVTPLACIAVADDGTLTTTQFGCDAVDARTLLALGTTHKGATPEALRGLVGGCQGVGFKQLAAVSAHLRLGLRVRGPAPARFYPDGAERPLLGFEVLNAGADVDWVTLKGGRMAQERQWSLPPVPEDFADPAGPFGFQQAVHLGRLGDPDAIFLSVMRAHLLLVCAGTLSPMRLVVPELGPAWLGSAEGAVCFWANANAPAGTVYLNGVRSDPIERDGVLAGCDVSVAVFVHDPYAHSTANRIESRAVGESQQREYWKAVAQEAGKPGSSARDVVMSVFTNPDTPLVDEILRHPDVYELKELVATLAAEHFEGGLCVIAEDLRRCPEAMAMLPSDGPLPATLAGRPIFEDTHNLRAFVEEAPFNAWSRFDDDGSSGYDFPAVKAREVVSGILIEKYPPTPTPANLEGPLWPRVADALLLLHGFCKKELPDPSAETLQLLFWHPADKEKREAREMRETLFGYGSGPVLRCMGHPQIGDAVMVFTKERLDTDADALGMLGSAIDELLFNSCVPYGVRGGFRELLLHRVAAGDPLTLDEPLKQLLKPPATLARNPKRRKVEN